MNEYVGAYSISQTAYPCLAQGMLVSLAQTVQSFPTQEWPFLFGRPLFLLVHRTGSTSARVLKVA
jgi:hypothetical protein